MPLMATHIVDDVQSEQVNECIPEAEDFIGCSVGIMAYNGETNIARTLQWVLYQKGRSIRLEKGIIVASGCTHRTIPIVTEVAQKEPRIQLSIHEQRVGK